MTPHEEAKEIFGQVLEVERHLRSSALDEACASRPHLRQEVESLLEAYEKAGTFIDAPLIGIPAETMIGRALGAYCIDAFIGEGGMGVVYRATDSKLNRPVAIKFLSDDLADPVARRRFQREAQMASSLNHPHIVTIHDVGDFEGRQYLVTEFIDGGTLKDWARAEKPSWRQIVELLLGVADGLATAHAAGILHRDIKPDNILVGRNGYAKLADFGLAKLEERPSPEAVTRTLASEPTRPGVILGTIAYMSPEQASGRPTDARSDIFSFGVVLYELLAGRRPFEGATDLELLQTIIHGAVQLLGADVPLPLRIVVEKSLEKDPAERYQSTRDLVVDLRRLVRQSGERTASDTSRPAAVRSLRKYRWKTALLTVLIVAGFLTWRVWRTGSGGTSNTEPLRAVPLNTLPGLARYPSFSPDGNYLAFTWTGPKQDNPDIYVQQIGSGSPLRLTTDPSNDYNPVWSPDGRSIAFLRHRWEAAKSELRLIPPLGGAERKVTEIQVAETSAWPPYLAWCPDSSCVVVTDSQGEGKPAALFVVSLESGDKRQLTYPNLPATGDTNPAVSSDGSWLVFRRNASAVETGELYRLPLGRNLMAKGEPQRLTQAMLDAEYPTWIPGSKEVLFSAKGNLWKLVVGGEERGNNTPARLPFVGDNGLMPVVSHPQPGRPPRLVYARSFQNYNTWRVSPSSPGAPASAQPSVAISSARKDYHVQFSPDGRRLAFASDRSGEPQVWLADPDGSNLVQLTTTGGAYPRWSPDGDWIVYQSILNGQWDVYMIPVAGGKPRNLTSNPAADAWPSFSWDGHWIYFDSNRTGQWQIWKIPASGGEAVPVTNGIAFEPFESPDRAYIYYVETRDRPSPLWRLPVSGGPPVKVLEGVVLFNFVVLKGGIYYIDRPSGEGGIREVDRPSGETRLQYFDFATRRSTTVARNLGNVFIGLTASADGRTVLYTRVDSSTDDLMLVENFR